MRRLFALMKKEFTHMRRDPRTLRSIFMKPLLQLFILGYAANTDIKNVSAVVFDEDQSQSSRALLDAYRASGFFQFDNVVFSAADVVRLIDTGAAKAGVIIPPSYANS